jgi:Flagellar protein FlhE.
MRAYALALLLISPLAMAVDGSWTSQGYGGTLVHGQQWLQSQPVAPSSALPARAVAARISWKITPDRKPSQALKMKLCSANRCLPLSSLRGELTPPGYFPAEGPWRFEYMAATRGPLYPALTLLTNQLSVQYRIVR